jgi:hypothetical protein
MNFNLNQRNFELSFALGVKLNWVGFYFYMLTKQVKVWFNWLHKNIIWLKRIQDNNVLTLLFKYWDDDILDRSELTRQIHYEWWYKRALANIIIKNIMVFFLKTERYSIKKILNNLKLQEKK